MFLRNNIYIVFLITIGVSLTSCFTGYKTIKPTVEQLQDIFIREDNAKLMKVDKLGNIYLLSARNSLKKFDAEGNLLYEYMNTLNGNMEDIDVSNPMKILVFFKDFQQLVCLDNNLSTLTQFNLRNNGFQEVSAVGLSNDNHFWIFDQIKLTLSKMNDQGRIIIESDNLLTQSGIELIADQILESSNYVVLRDEDNLMMLDNFGQWIRNFSFTSNDLVSVTGRYLYVLSDNSLFALPHSDFSAEISTIRIFNEEIRSIGFGDKILVLTAFGVKRIEE